MNAMDRRATVLGAVAFAVLAIAEFLDATIPWRAAWGLAILLPFGLLGFSCLMDLFATQPLPLPPGTLYAAAALALLSVLFAGAAPSVGTMGRLMMSAVFAAAMLAGSAFLRGRSSWASVAALILWLCGGTLLAFDVLLRPGSVWVSGAYGFLFAITALAAVAGLLALVHPQSAPSRILAGTALMLLFSEFVQYIVFWSGGRPDRLIWYLERAAQPWPTIAALSWLLLLAGAAISVAGWRRIAGSLILAGSVAVLVWRTVPETPDVAAAGLAAILVAIALASIGLFFALRERT